MSTINNMSAEKKIILDRDVCVLTNFKLLNSKLKKELVTG